MTDKHIGQMEAQRILSNLKARITPTKPEILNYYTVGDHFQHSLLKVKSDIVGLLQRPAALERVIIGDFGTGKSHFLRYLGWLLQTDLQQISYGIGGQSRPPNYVITQVNLEDLKDAGDLQRFIVQGMRWRGQGEDWLQVFTNSFTPLLHRIRHDTELGLMTNKNLEEFMSLVVFSILRATPAGTVLTKGLFDFLYSRSRFKNASLRTPFNMLTQEYRRVIGNVNYDHRLFVEAFIRSVTKPTEQNRATLEAAMNDLSQKGDLTDVVFKILALAEVDLIIILADELEALGSSPNATQGLSAIKKFHDNLDKAGQNRPQIHNLTGGSEYPATAFICASTQVFFDSELQNKHIALYDRWLSEATRVRLTPLAAADVDNLIFRLRELFYFSGRDLPPVTEGENALHDVIRLRVEALRALSRESLADLPPTARNLIPMLIESIEQNAIAI